MAWSLSNRLLYVAIFFSGLSALVYQLIWVRLMGLVFGVSSFAVATVASYLLIEVLSVYRQLYKWACNGLDFYGMSLVRLLLSVAVLLPPVFLIGGAMPLIAKYSLTATRTLGSGFSRIYFLNTLGAFAGALLTGFVLIPFAGP